MKSISMRALAIVLTAALVQACSTQPTDPEDWTISADSYGPITVDMTQAEIVDTGAFRVAPSACSFGRLDWHTQKYESLGDPDHDGKSDYSRVGPGGGISLDGHGKPEYIDPYPGTKTDEGIGRGDTFKELKEAYGQRLIPDTTTIMKHEAFYGVSGKRSHLVFSLYRDKVETFYLTPGALKGEFGADIRGIGC